MNYFNTEGYPDPTAYYASKLIADEKRRQNYRPLVYVCSPFSGDTERNTENARRYCRFVVDSKCIPFAPHLFLPQFMSDETERDIAMFFNKVYLGKCDELWVFGDTISAGMQKEINWATKRAKRIRYFTDDFQEVRYVCNK